MGIYSENFASEEDFGLDMNTLVEAFLIDDLMHNYSESTVKEFCAPGGVGEALVEAKVLGKQSVVRMSKSGDMNRRTVITAIQMAKSKNDPLVNKMIKYKVLYKQARNKIVQKYGSKASRAALKAQKEYIKTMRNVNLPSVNSAMNAVTNDSNR